MISEEEIVLQVVFQIIVLSLYLLTDSFSWCRCHCWKHEIAPAAHAGCKSLFCSSSVPRQYVLSQKSLLCLPARSQDSRGDAYLVESVSDSLVNGGYFLGV